MGHTSRRKLLSLLWLFAVLIWSCVRIAAVKFWLSDYGVNTKIFAAVELLSALIYGISSSRFLISVIDKQIKSAAKWGTVAATTYLAPDLYVFTSGQSLPVTAFLVIGLLLVVTLLQLFWQLRGRLPVRR